MLLRVCLCVSACALACMCACLCVQVPASGVPESACARTDVPPARGVQRPACACPRVGCTRPQVPAPVSVEAAGAAPTCAVRGSAMGWARRSGAGSRSERSRLWKSGSGRAGPGAASQQSSRARRTAEAASMAPAELPPPPRVSLLRRGPPGAFISGPREPRAAEASHPGPKCAHQEARPALDAPPFEDPRSTLLAGVRMFAASSGNYIATWQPPADSVSVVTGRGRAAARVRWGPAAEHPLALVAEARSVARGSLLGPRAPAAVPPAIRWLIACVHFPSWLAAAGDVLLL